MHKRDKKTAKNVLFLVILSITQGCLAPQFIGGQIKNKSWQGQDFPYRLAYDSAAISTPLAAISPINYPKLQPGAHKKIGATSDQRLINPFQPVPHKHLKVQPIYHIIVRLGYITHRIPVQITSLTHPSIPQHRKIKHIHPAIII